MQETRLNPLALDASNPMLISFQSLPEVVDWLPAILRKVI
jgi:hypothetical protein